MEETKDINIKSARLNTKLIQKDESFKTSQQQTEMYNTKKLNLLNENRPIFLLIRSITFINYGLAILLFFLGLMLTFFYKEDIQYFEKTEVFDYEANLLPDRTIYISGWYALSIFAGDIPTSGKIEMAYESKITSFSIAYIVFVFLLFSSFATQFILNKRYKISNKFYIHLQKNTIFILLGIIATIIIGTTAFYNTEGTLGNWLVNITNQDFASLNYYNLPGSGPLVPRVIIVLAKSHQQYSSGGIIQLFEFSLYVLYLIWREINFHFKKQIEPVIRKFKTKVISVK